MRFLKIRSVLATLLLVGLSSTVALAVPPDEPTNTGVPNPTTAPAAPKGKLPVMPAIPAFEQLQKQQFPKQFQNEFVPQDLNKAQVLCNTFINLLAQKHFTLTKYEDQQAFLAKWLPKIKDIKTLEEADKLNIEAMESLGQRFDYYMSPDDKASEESMSDPSIVGIGITIGLRDMDELLDPLPEDAKQADVEKVLVITDEHPLVVTPYPQSPAHKAGLWDGDIIREIDGKPVKGMKLKDAIALIRGKRGTKVKFTVERKEDALQLAKMALEAMFGTPSEFLVPKVPETGKTVTKTIEVERDLYIAPVVHVKELDDGTTIIKLDNFMANNAAAEMLKALREVAAKAKGRVILDLRNNGGGRLDHAINIVQYMLPEGTIVRLRQRDGSNMLNIHYTASRDALITTQQMPWNPAMVNYSAAQRVIGVPETVPIVVLINKWTASASELTSGALQFHKRAKIVGENSIGKGVGQQVIDLPEGRRTHITTFYFDPAARIIDFEGIHPDVTRTLEPEAKQLKELQSKLRGLLKDNASGKTRLDEIAARLPKLEADLTAVKAALEKAEADLNAVKADLGKATKDSDKDALSKKQETLLKDKQAMSDKQGTLLKEKEALGKEKDQLATKSATNDAELVKTRQALHDLHKMLRENDPQVQEARKLVIKEGERIAAEEKAKADDRAKWVEKKKQEWEQQRKLREEIRKKQQQAKKAAA